MIQMHCQVKKQKKNIEDQGREYPFLFMRHHLFQPELFYILENPYEGKKKRTKSPKYKDTLKRGIFFP